MQIIQPRGRQRNAIPCNAAAVALLLCGYHSYHVITIVTIVTMWLPCGYHVVTIVNNYHSYHVVPIVTMWFHSNHSYHVVTIITMWLLVTIVTLQCCRCSS